MAWPDVVNGSLELLAGITAFASVRTLMRDKRVHGISPWDAALKVTYATWFLAYMLLLGQWWSFAGALTYFIAVVIWTALALYYFFRPLISKRD